jgi:ABC-2 type transport system ATP-binding protein
MSEMALTAEHLIVIGRGKLIADTSVADFVAGASKKLVHVRTPQAGALREILSGLGATVIDANAGMLDVTGLTAEQIGDAAAAQSIALHELRPHQASLEEAFMDLTRGEIEYAAVGEEAA